MVKKIDYPKTIISLKVGEFLIVPMRDYQENSLRTIVTRLGKREDKKYKVKKYSMSKAYTVTRIS